MNTFKLFGIVLSTDIKPLKCTFSEEELQSFFTKTFPVELFSYDWILYTGDIIYSVANCSTLFLRTTGGGNTCNTRYVLAMRRHGQERRRLQDGK